MYLQDTEKLRMMGKLTGGLPDVGHIILGRQDGGISVKYPTVWNQKPKVQHHYCQSPTT
jgi:hypothetical protein